MTDLRIPAAMREAAARALLAEDRVMAGGYGEKLGEWDDLTEDQRFLYLATVDTVLSASLGVCEVRAEKGMRQANSERPDLDGELWGSDLWIDEVVRGWANIPADQLSPWSWARLTRLRITTPAEDCPQKDLP